MRDGGHGRGARGRQAATAARRLELRCGRLDINAAPATAGQWAVLVTSADDDQHAQMVNGSRGWPARRRRLDAGEEQRH
ncbi:hypothetical protein Syun_029525 [Stephania yunnanensis]|uniref:Uncharacterized protein n=1 Tax=Stephania yunnanensis TaxID=152371 RepID=A0AAP0E5S5_9MAGN